ncbi:hypothetical protein JCM19237_2821 [Photobacterium aphoticum]|uniref:Uncharacterized protein n=1 Tax=Photobacterium aphoticum TaxID=754436 RepID=A0A090QXW5_9GAMM|nr:hypothetical protein JCM19237_2821 [Photobacterium aphoticum]
MNLSDLIIEWPETASAESEAITLDYIFSFLDDYRRQHVQSQFHYFVGGDGADTAQHAQFDANVHPPYWETVQDDRAAISESIRKIFAGNRQRVVIGMIDQKHDRDEQAAIARYLMFGGEWQQAMCCFGLLFEDNMLVEVIEHNVCCEPLVQ